jgi:hypothetical protein
MWEDPVVEAVRKVRDAHAAEFNYDLRAIYRALKEEEAQSGRRYVKLSPKRVEQAAEAQKKGEPSAA